jgi:2-methylcitrate dehydratase
MLLRKVRVRPEPDLSARFPRELPCRVRIHLQDGRVLTEAKCNYLGFASRPMTWGDVLAKFRQLCAQRVSSELQERIASCVDALDQVDVQGLCSLLEE